MTLVTIYRKQFWADNESGPEYSQNATIQFEPGSAFA